MAPMIEVKELRTTRLTCAALCLVWVATLPGCAFLVGGTVDYVLAVAGTVKDPLGQPVEGVQVTLETNGSVYQGTQTVRRQSFVTDAYGTFQFTYITHRSGTPYVLVFEKEGYGRHTVTATSPPTRQHMVTLQPVQATSPTHGGRCEARWSRRVAEQGDEADKVRAPGS